MINLIFIGLITGAIVVFSVQNVSNVTVSFLVWQFDLSVSMMVISAVLAGIIVAQLLRGLIIKRQEKAKNTEEFVTGHHR